MKKFFNASEFAKDYVKSDLYKNNSFLSVQKTTGIPKSTLHDIATERCEKLSTNNFFALCSAAKLNPLKYWKK